LIVVITACVLACMPPQSLDQATANKATAPTTNHIGPRIDPILIPSNQVSVVIQGKTRDNAVSNPINPVRPVHNNIKKLASFWFSSTQVAIPFSTGTILSTIEVNKGKNASHIATLKLSNRAVIFQIFSP